jgi:crotonobetainyl-CoA:carnitine CoA-transferase CaiB-like acyl-CoA transferase
VIMDEPPEGGPTRSIPPFLNDQPGPCSSLFFLAYDAGKRSITANLDTPTGRAIVWKLLLKSDFLIESFPRGYMDSIGFGYDSLSRDNPGLIFVSIYPFGDRGPGCDYKAADIVTWAAGGMMFLMGKPGRPPLEMSLPQARLHAGAEAAVAALLAHSARSSNGRGQRVIVDMQACVVWTLMNEQAMPIMHGDILRREGEYLGSKALRRKLVFKCRDGFVVLMIAGGTAGAGSTARMVQWMDEHGYAAPWMKTTNWLGWTPVMFMALNQRDLDENAELEDSLQRFFLTMDKQTIFSEGVRRRILLAPVSTVADIANDAQLKARNFFVEVKSPAGDLPLRMPGAFARFSRTPVEPPRPAPRLGEHNQEVYCGLLGISLEQLASMRAEGAV